MRTVAVGGLAEALHVAALDDLGAVLRFGVDPVDDRGPFRVAFVAALDVPVLDPVGGDDHVVAAAAEEAVDAGLAEQHVGLRVADQDVVVEGALEVLVGAQEADFVAVLDRVDPGPARFQRDVERAGVGLGLGEGSVVFARPAVERPARAAAARRQQVAAAFAVEVGRAWEAADQPVGAVAAVDVVGAGAGLDQVFLGAAVDRVVAFAAIDADEVDRFEAAFDGQFVVAGAEVGHHPARRPERRAGHLLGVALGAGAAFARGERRLGGDREGAGGRRCVGDGRRFTRLRRAFRPGRDFFRFAFGVGDGELVGPAAADDLQATAARRVGVEGHVGGAGRGRFLAAGDQRRAALAAVGALAAVQGVAPAAADDRVVARAAVDHVRLRVADQRVVEGRAFDRLEAEEPVVAVAERLVLRQRDPDAAPLLPRDRGREGGDVVGAGAAVHAVVAVVAADDVFVAGAAVDGVDAEPAADLVLVAGAAAEVVGAAGAEGAGGG